MKRLAFSGFDTALVEDMECMFYKCPVVTVEDVQNFNTESVTKYDYFLEGTGWESLFE